MLKKRVPGNWVTAASQPRSWGSQAHRVSRERLSWVAWSASVMAGVWACRSCSNEAAVNQIEPTKNVTESAVPPTPLA